MTSNVSELDLPSAPDATAEQASRHRDVLDRLFARIGDATSFPPIAVRLMGIDRESATGADDVRAAIETDLAMAKRILRGANSSDFSSAAPVNNLKDAISNLGFTQIRNMAVTAYVGQLLQESGEYHTYSRQKLWNHMVSAGCTARMVAGVCGLPFGDDAYLAGLVHDVGYILIDKTLHRHFRDVLDRLEEERDTTLVERKILTFDHAQLGEFVARQWNFPAPITDAIAFHHRPDEYNGENQAVVFLTALSNFLASRYGDSALGIHNAVAPDLKVLAGLGIKNQQFTAICDKMAETLQDAKNMASL